MTPTVRSKTQPVVPGSHARPGFGSQTFRAIAVVQFVLGSLCIIVGIVDNLTKSFLGEVGHGIWGGLLCVSAGVSGVYASSNKSTRSILVCMVLSTVSAFAGIIAFGLTVDAVASEARRISCAPAVPTQPPTTTTIVCRYDYKTMHVAVDSVLLLFELLLISACVLTAYLATKAVWPVDLGRFGQTFPTEATISGNGPAVSNGPTLATEPANEERDPEMQPVSTNGTAVSFKKESETNSVKTNSEENKNDTGKTEDINSASIKVDIEEETWRI
ncbi:uncharacterized protein LOC106157310 [Lingula anatina]|uniref:Uncharacterized protein LOC106157310 n=1 Tax=Lingula anatina TaxID=7574 RepID=A0A1S3HQS3_LINAN|nr:uncharacterized protein LOC106157310 [Lingula anatina]|eukprot:XP_013388387.1 uncharacterized protein LOC106157310 [Lingula anatina]